MRTLLIMMAMGWAMSATGCGAAGPKNKIALTNVVVVDRYDPEPGVNPLQGGGSMGGSGYFRTITAARVNECSRQIREAYQVWMAKKQLTAQGIDAPGDVLFAASSNAIDGVFELKYSIDREHHLAEGSVWYYRKNGVKVEPGEIPTLLSQNDVADLQDKIDTAIRCAQGE